MEILEENSTNWLVLTNDGGTETKTKSSDLNRLLYEHNLWGLLDAGNEIWTSDGAEDEPKVMVIPFEDSEKYTLKIDGFPDLTLGEHHKTDLVDALGEVYQNHDGEAVAPLLDLYDSVRSNMVREKVLSHFQKVLGSRVELQEDGWFINGHLLLTYEGDFYHPNTESRKRSGGSVIGKGSSAKAYNVASRKGTEDIQRSFSYKGEDYRLTDKEVTFLSRAMWAIKNTPDRRDK